MRLVATIVALSLATALAAALPATAEERAEEARDRGPLVLNRGRPNRLVLDWDHGLEYRLLLGAPELEARDPTGLAQGFDLQGHVGAELFLDGGWVRGEGLDEGWNAELRRARVYTRGTLSHWVRTEYKVAFEVEKSSFYLNDFYFAWRVYDIPGGTLKVGYFDPPVSLAALGSATERGLAEVGLPVSAFAPGYRLGVELSGRRPAQHLSWAVSLTTVGQDQREGDASDAALRLNGRLVWRPWRIEPEFDPGAPAGAEPSLLHLGASFGFTLTGSGDTRYRTRPETRLVEYLVDTGAIEGGDAALLGLEAAWRRGPVSVQAELLTSWVAASDYGDPFFWGAYAQVGWVVTGEARPYDAVQGVFDRVVPRAPLSPRDGHWGALELTARLSWVDLEDAGVRGGRLLALTAGTSWTWNAYVRVLAGYTFAHSQGRPDATDAHVLSARFELRF